jgi:hypothetical protein
MGYGVAMARLKAALIPHLKGRGRQTDAARLIKSLGLLTLFLFVATVATRKAIVDRVFQRSIVIAQDFPKSHFQDFPHVTALSLRGSIATPKFINC